MFIWLRQYCLAAKYLYRQHSAWCPLGHNTICTVRSGLSYPNIADSFDQWPGGTPNPAAAAAAAPTTPTHSHRGKERR